MISKTKKTKIIGAIVIMCLATILPRWLFLPIFCFGIFLFCWITIGEKLHKQIAHCAPGIANLMTWFDSFLENLGPRNYCFLRVSDSDLENRTTPLPLYMESTDSFAKASCWISPASANRNIDDKNSSYWTEGRQILVEPVFKGTLAIKDTILPGDYFVDISAIGNDGLIERLKITESDSKLMQSIEIKTESGKLIYSFPPKS